MFKWTKYSSIAKYATLLSGIGGLALAAEVPSVIVTGRPRLKLRPPVSSELDGESVLMPDSPNPTLSRALRESPSVMVRESGGEGSAPQYVIRGLDPSQTRYFLDGISLTDAEYQTGNLHLIPVDALYRSDIYPEGVPTFLGADGLGGAIDLKLDPLLSPTSVAVRTGSFGFWNLGAEVSTQSPPFRLHLDARQSQEDFPYFDNNGTPFNPSDDRVTRRVNNDFKRLTLLPRLRLVEHASGELNAFSMTTLSEGGISGPVQVPLTGRLSQIFHLTALKYAGNLSEDVGTDTHLFVRISDDKTSDYSGSVSALPLSKASGIASGTKARFVMRLSNVSLDFLTGMTFEHFKGHVEQDGVANLVNRRVEFPLGIVSSIPLGPLSIKPALLNHFYEYRKIEGKGVDRSYLLSSPRLGLSWEPARAFRLRSSMGRYYRAPAMAEMFGSPAGIAANPDLSPETAEKLDVGFDLEFQRATKGLEGFRLSYTYSVIQARDLIAFVVNSQQSRMGVNIGKALIQSHEAGLEIVPRSIPVSLRVAAALMQAENRSDISYQYGRSLPYRPPYRAEFGLRYEKGGLGFGYSISLMGPAYADLANAQSHSGSVEHNTYAEWKTKRIGHFGLEIRNLTDVLTSRSEWGAYQWVDNSSSYPGYPLPGRRWYLSWKNEF